MRTPTILGVALCLMMLAGCHTVRFVNGNAEQTGPTVSEWHHTGIYSLIEFSKPVYLTSRCQGMQWSQVTTKKSILNSLTGYLDNLLFVGYLDVWEPLTVEYACSAVGPQPVIALTEKGSSTEKVAAPIPVPAATQATPIRREVSVIEDRKRLVFFDIVVTEALTELRGKEKLLTRVMASELFRHKELEVLDQSTRDSLLVQRKMNLEDCRRAECRFAMAKALPGMELVLEATVDSIASQCTLNIQIKSVKTGLIVNSVFDTISCDPNSLIESVQAATRKIWPPR